LSRQLNTYFFQMSLLSCFTLRKIKIVKLMSTTIQESQMAFSLKKKKEIMHLVTTDKPWGHYAYKPDTGLISHNSTYMRCLKHSNPKKLEIGIVAAMVSRRRKWGAAGQWTLSFNYARWKYSNNLLFHIVAIMNNTVLCILKVVKRVDLILSAVIAIK
jgi:hypothetical protein